MKFTEEELEKYKKQKMEEIDRWLDNEYGVSYTRLEELHDFVIEQDMKHQEEKVKEIERLNNLLKETSQTLSEQTIKAITLKSENERLNNIIKKVKDYIRIKSIKFTMAYVEDDGRIDLSRSDYRIDKLTSKQVKELLGILEKENKND